jgi:KUP system potassium uptake protein
MADTQIDSSQDRQSLVLPALGVVFGDIGTSPLYALRVSFHGNEAPALNIADVLGVLSLIVWALLLVISLKYLAFVLRAHNKGEGGIIALVALLNPWRAKKRSTRHVMMLLGLFGACLLYGDGTITPAISVLSAVEGLEVAEPAISHLVIPITVVILIGLFSIQRHGSGRIGRWFGPIMLVWFLVLALLGLHGMWVEPKVLMAINPIYAIQFLAGHGLVGYLTLGAVFLVVTGGEALYADLGHFGARPIRHGWFLIVLPALLINYLGQGALLIADPGAVDAPFFRLAPVWATMPLVALATVATIIASQAVITGTFSLTRQAIQFGQLPRMRVIHTDASEAGQIYLPLVNWVLMLACLLLVLSFRSSEALASAYGVAVSMDMLITTILTVTVALRFGWFPAMAVLGGACFLVIDSAFLGANLFKIADGGWYALMVGGLIFIVMATWRNGRRLLAKKLEQRGTSIEAFIADLESDPPHRVPGTAVVMVGSNFFKTIPASLTHHLQCSHVLHERVILLNVETEMVPHVAAADRLDYETLGAGVIRMQLHYGFSQTPNVPVALKLSDHFGLSVDTDDVIYILARETIIPRREIRSLAFYWQEVFFSWLTRNAGRATVYYNLPPERVLELGLQVEI